MTEAELRLLLLPLAAEEPRSAPELARALGATVALVRGALADLVLNRGALVADQRGRYHAFVSPSPVPAADRGELVS